MRLLLSILLLLAVLLPLTPKTAQAAPPTAASIIVSDLRNQEVQVPHVTPRMRRYSYTGYALYFIGTAYGLLLLWGILATRLSARLRIIAERLSQRRFLTLLFYYLLLSVVLIALDFPLTFYGGFWLDHAYGLSHESLGAWLSDQAISQAIGIAITVPLLWLLFWLIKRSPRRWGLWLWAAAIPILAFGIFLEPILIEPLFNHFTPLPPGPLRTCIHALAEQAGIPNAPIYVADASRRTDTANAYVTGLGPTARIVIWDTTIKELPQDEVVGIVGHEMGHYVEKHIVWGFFAGVLGLLIALPLGQWIIEFLTRRYGERWRLHGLNDFAVVPVLFLTLNGLSFLSDPIVNGASRYIEHRADAYGLRVTHDGPDMARAFVFFARHDLDDPNPPPFIKFWLYTHPPLSERINFVMGRK
jgi:STE24 endopeptidase